MTRDISASLEAFVGRLKQKHPTLAISCDVPETSTGSTWIDIRVGAEWIVVEYDRNLGFGLTDPRDEDGHLYGSPPSRFVRTTEEALEEIDLMLHELAVSAAPSLPSP